MRLRRARGAARALAVGAAVLAGLAFFVLPAAGVLARAPWSTALRALRSEEVLTAARLSILTSSLAVGLCALVGLPLAWMLSRTRLRGRSLARAIVLLPLVLPPTVAGVALLAAFGPEGILGGGLDRIGVSLPGTIPATVLAEAFVAAPFFVLAAEAGFRSVELRYEEAAATLGAGGSFRFRTVTLPLARRSLAAGLAICWARALGEFGATITFAGNVPARTRTLPVEVSLALRDNPDSALAVSLIMIAIALAVIVGFRRALFGGGR